MSATARRKNEFLQENFYTNYVHAAIVNTDTTFKLFKLARRMRLTRVTYINPTGLAENASNKVKIQVKNGSTIAAEWDTDSAGAGDNSVPADAHIDVALSATDANRNFAVGDVVSFAVDCTGTVTLPADGKIYIEGVYY